MEDKEIKTMALDLAKIISYLNEMQKGNDQNYITTEGLAFLEGVILAGNSNVRVMPLEEHKRIVNIIKNKKKSFLSF